MGSKLSPEVDALFANVRAVESEVPFDPDVLLADVLAQATPPGAPASDRPPPGASAAPASARGNGALFGGLKPWVVGLCGVALVIGVVATRPRRAPPTQRAAVAAVAPRAVTPPVAPPVVTADPAPVAPPAAPAPVTPPSPQPPALSAHARVVEAPRRAPPPPVAPPVTPAAPAPVEAPVRVDTGNPVVGDPAPAVDPLAGEIALLDAAEDALRESAPSRALALLSRYDALHPQGQLRAQMLSARVRAWCAQGDPEQARNVARELFQFAPRSAAARRARASCVGDLPETQGGPR